MMQQFREASKLTSKCAFVRSLFDMLTYDLKCRSEPLLWWWNKYTAYHGLTHATTPSQTISRLQRNPAGVVVGGTQFIFHRTFRVPDSGINNLPAVRRSSSLRIFSCNEETM